MLPNSDTHLILDTQRTHFSAHVPAPTTAGGNTLLVCFCGGFLDFFFFNGCLGFILFCFVGPIAQHVRSQFSWSNQGSNLCPLQWKHRILIPGLPGLSQDLLFIGVTLVYNIIYVSCVEHYISISVGPTACPPLKIQFPTSPYSWSLLPISPLW